MVYQIKNIQKLIIIVVIKDKMEEYIIKILQLIKLTEDYLCNTETYWGRNCKYLLQNKIHNYVENAVLTLQRLCVYILTHKSIIEKRILKYKENEKRKKENSAIKIQSIYRSYHQRKILLNESKKRFEKLYIYSTKSYQYKDLKTNKIYTKKPYTLYKSDIEKERKIYDDKDDYTVLFFINR